MKTQNTTEKKESKMDKKVPSNKYSIYPITVTEWDNEGLKTYTIQKSYKDKDGEWQNTDSYNEADLCVISKILSNM